MVRIHYGDRADAVVGTSIDLSGYKTNSKGKLLYNDATVKVLDSNMVRVTIENYFIGNYTSVQGDSGSPVTTSGENRKLIGIHTGTLCEFTSPSTGVSTNVWSTFNGTSLEANVGDQLCGKIAMDLQDLPNSNISPQSWYYKVIVPWELIKSQFNLR